MYSLLLSFALTASAQMISVNTPSSGGFTAGQDVTGDDGVFKTLQSTGTAPSLTATGGVSKGSWTVLGVSGLPSVFIDNPADDNLIRMCNRTRSSACANFASLTIGNGGLFTLLHEGEPILAHSYPNTYFNSNSVKVGIGTASPASKLHVSSGAIQVAGTGAQVMVGLAHQAPGADWNVNGANTLLVSNTGSVADADKGYQVQVFYNGTLAANEGGAISLGGTYNSTGGLANFGGIKAYKQNATDGNVGGGLDFYTRLNSAGVSARKVRINPDGGLLPYSRTIAQLLAITPEVTGEMYFCNNCSPLKMVVSTGTSAGNFASIDGGAFQ